MSMELQPTRAKPLPDLPSLELYDLMLKERAVRLMEMVPLEREYQTADISWLTTGKDTSKDTIHPVCYLAGNSLNLGTKVNDIDLFPVTEKDASATAVWLKGYPYMTSTLFATTYPVKPYPVQWCRFYHASLQALIEAFDFSHIQLGAKMIYNRVICQWEAKEVFYTEAHLRTKLTGMVSYHPVNSRDHTRSSAHRLHRYVMNGHIPPEQYDGLLDDILLQLISLERRE